MLESKKTKEAGTIGIDPAKAAEPEDLTTEALKKNTVGEESKIRGISGIDDGATRKFLVIFNFQTVTN